MLHGAQAAAVGALVRQVFHAGHGVGQRLAHVLADVQLFAHAPLEHARAQFQRAGPGEGLAVQAVRVAEPRVAAEHLVAALAGEHEARLRGDFAGKEQQRAVHVGHAGEAARVHGLLKRLRQRRLL